MSTLIATSSDIGSVVRKATFTPVAFVGDNWIIGPASSSMDQHIAERSRMRPVAGTQFVESILNPRFFVQQ